LPLNYPQYDGVDLQNGDRIASMDMWRHFTLCIQTVPATELDDVNGLLHPACFATVCNNSPLTAQDDPG